MQTGVRFKMQACLNMFLKRFQTAFYKLEFCAKCVFPLGVYEAFSRSSGKQTWLKGK
jgi:hypothetical protein